MCELMTEEKIEKIKASSVDIIVEKIDGKPYYGIKYFDLKENQGYIGFGSFNLDYVFEWKDKYFDIVEEDQSSKNEMRNDLISRKVFLDELKLYCNRTFLGEISSSSEISVGELSTIIKNLPSDYNLDLVCEELEKREKYFREYGEKYHNAEGMSAAEACAGDIEIVRNGGKNENKSSGWKHL